MKIRSNSKENFSLWLNGDISDVFMRDMLKKFQASDVVNMPLTTGKCVGKGFVTVKGYTIKYNYFTRSDSLINVGTYVIIMED